MKSWTRRDLVKATLAASAGAVGSTVMPPELRALNESDGTTPAGIAAPLALESASAKPLRELLSMDRGWRFHLGHACDPEKDFGFGKLAQNGTFAKSGEAGGPAGITAKSPFDDSAWPVVNLPHDWAVDLPFVLDKTLVWHGGKPLGRPYPDTSIGWYRKTFTISKDDLGKRISVQFDGVYRDAMVFFNGHYLGQNFSGYVPFEFDVSDFINYGEENLLVLRVDATLNEGWFYEGAGIYRHVWLLKTAPVHIARWGNFVQSSFPSGLEGPATLKITTEVVNESDSPADCTVHARILGLQGTQFAAASSRPVTLAPSETRVLEMQATVHQPSLWSLENPHLYHLATSLSVQGAAVDQDETTFGIRTLRFDADRGFFLNGKPVKIKGTCNHQDHAALGVALPNRMQSYRIGLLKEMGSNAYRTSHNIPTSELLHACDHQGMLVLDETRNFSSSPGGLSELERMIKRDRNHPSVILWSIANEERQQGTERGARIGKSMKKLVSRLDPTRPITAAMNGEWGKGLSGVVDVQGFNYRTGNIDAYRQQFPKQPLLGTEVASTVSTRGIYANDPVRGYVSAYDNEKPKWGATAEEWWKFYDERAWLAGGFVWTGFDYRGEPTPYHLPCVSSHFGLMDTCGFPKDNYFYYRAWWQDAPVLHLFPHWNWAGQEGSNVEVWCYSNQDSVELFLNGSSLGSQRVEKNGHLVWNVKYAPGTLEARAFHQGKLVLSAKRETAGAPSQIHLKSDRPSIKADGEDLAVIQVAITDSRGVPAPLAGNMVHFTLTGPGQILGVGNGDPSSYEPDHASQRSAFNGLCMCIVQVTKTPGTLILKATSPGLEDTQVQIESTPATARPSIS